MPRTRTPRVPRTLEQRFWKKVAVAGRDECHEWIGNRNVGHHYGLIYEDAAEAAAAGRPKRALYAHRVAYELAYGPLPADSRHFHVHHTCGNRGCVNPEHLRLMGIWEHTLEHGTTGPAKNAVKTHCVHGHEFTPENTYRRSGGGRKCKTCSLANAAYLFYVGRKTQTGTLK